MLKRLFELREKLKVFVIEKDMKHLQQLCEHKFEIELVFLGDIFAHLNQLNLHLECSGIRKMEDESNIFYL